MILSDASPLVSIPPEYAVKGHDVWDEIKTFFSMDEFDHPEKMDVAFLRMLYRSRKMAGFPFRLISDYREANKKSAHSELPCCAVDVQLLNAWERQRINRASVMVGFIRSGCYPGTDGEYKGKTKKDGGGFHLDASRTKGSAMWTRGIKVAT